MIDRFLRQAGSLPLAALIGLAACSGGGSDSGGYVPPPPAPPPVSSSEPEWQPGVFEAASRFKDRCEIPRSGVDLEGNPYPDEPGSTTIENFWLRSWTHETYLWNDEVPDEDPASYDSRLAYFDILRTTAVTPSGAPKDQFHFSEPTEQFLADRNAAPSAGYGARIRTYAARPPRDVRVLYTDPGTPASAVVDGQQQLVRGSRILEVDGVDLVWADTAAEIDTLLAGLYPDAVGEVHSFLVEDPGDPEPREIMLTAAAVSTVPVGRVEALDQPGGRVGYLLLNTFSPYSTEEALIDAMRELEAAAVDDLVLDLRYNGGGLLAIASQLSYMIAGPGYTSGRTFERLRFNDDAGAYNPVTGAFNDPTPFFATALGFSVADGTPLPRLDLRRVYVLATEATCSASESVINALRGVDFEVVLIGDTTCGKPYGFYPTDNCGETYYTIQFQGVNNKGFGDYPNGFTPRNSGAIYAESVPGCTAPDDLSADLGDPAEALLRAALDYRETGQCLGGMATASSRASSPASQTPSLAEGRPLPVLVDPMTVNRDMRLPNEGGRL
ncbi:S41 family peptidase [Parvularcula oceani]|uniref:S41 family peptidase n=1 Tax=Parvularcula oceani TaxID=1247963 RepID=UPI00056755AC|nr:S41 family peptidase [Parvularcula oceani]